MAQAETERNNSGALPPPIAGDNNAVTAEVVFRVAPPS